MHLIEGRVEVHPINYSLPRYHWIDEQADADNKNHRFSKTNHLLPLNTQLRETDQIQTDKVKKAIFG